MQVATLHGHTAGSTELYGVSIAKHKFWPDKK